MVRMLSPARLVFLLGALLLLSAPAAAQAQPGDPALRVEFRDMSFKLPGPGWVRRERTLEPGQVPPFVDFDRTEELHLLRVVASSGQMQPGLRILTAPEQAALIFRSERASPVPEGVRWEWLPEGEREIAGVRYPVLGFRAVVDAQGLAFDGLALLYFPPDLLERGRFYALWWYDNHSPSIPPKGLEEFDALVSSFSVRPVGEVLLADDFEDPETGFPKAASDPDRWEQGYVDGEYMIRRLDPEVTTTRPVWPPNLYQDVSIAVDARLEGEAERRRVYVGCRRFGSPVSQYRLAVEPATGTFLLDRADRGDLVTLVNLRASPVINRGNETNRLELSCFGTTISASINGTQVGSVQDETHRDVEGTVNIAASAPGGSLVDARFDNLVVTQR